MKLEKQVCSLELAKKLKELGVKQESLWFYNSKTMKLQRGFSAHTSNKGMTWSISAFTVAELGEMLPSGYYSIREGSVWECWLRNGTQKVEASTEADARAKMLIYLLENKLMLQEAE